MRYLKMFIAIWLLLFLLPLQSSSTGIDETDNDPGDTGVIVERRWIESYEGEIMIDPGEDHIVEIDPSGMMIEPEGSDILDPAAEKALEEVPEWMRLDLRHKFGLLPPREQETYGELITEAPGEELKDEIAFCIAHSTPQTLTDDNFFPEILTHNAELIYDHDAYLEYVSIVEKEDHTTLSYRQSDGTEVEIDRDLYYWYVVHPKLEDELPTYVDPDYDYTSDPPFDRNHGTAPPDGMYWRDRFFTYNKEGQQLLSDSLSGKNTTLDAIKAINGWVSSSMQFTSDQERPVQPVRIYEKGIGRCGEYQDMRSAAARTALIPVVATSNSAEDHVWNEFWDKEWYHWDGTIDNPRMYENSWGKTISSVWNARGDGYTWPVTSRYSDVCTLDISVIDSMWNPVDGATVDILTENFYQPDIKSTTISGTTDQSGSLVLEVGEDRNYWGRASTSDLGSDPPGPLPPMEIVMGSVVGETYKVVFQLPMQADDPIIIEQETPAADPMSLVLDISFEVGGNILRGSSPIASGRFDFRNISGGLDLFITNQVGLAAYGAGAPFNSYVTLKRANQGDIRMNISGDDQWAVVFSNGYSQWTSKILSYNISISALYGVRIDSPQQDVSIMMEEELPITGVYLCPEEVFTLEIRIGEEGDWIEQPKNIYADDDGQDVRAFWHDHFVEATNEETLTIWVRLTTSDGSEHIVYREVRIEDGRPPRITLDQSDPSTRKGEELHLSGSVNDNLGVDSMWYTLEGSSQRRSVQLSEEGRSWDLLLSSASLEVGDHSLTVFAQDTSGNAEGLTVAFKVHDTEPPEIKLETPDRGALIKKGDDVTIKGRMYKGLDIEELSVSIGGSRDIDITDSLLDDGTFSYDLSTDEASLDDGRTVIKVRAVDEGRNMGISEVEVRIDATSPTIILEEGQSEIVQMSSFDLDLKMEIFDEIGPVQVEMDINGNPFGDVTRYLDGKLFEIRVDVDDDMKPGWNTITIRATDEAGWISEEMIDCFVDEMEPGIGIVDAPEYAVIGQDLGISLELMDDDRSRLFELKGNGLYFEKDDPGMYLDIVLDTSDCRKGRWELDLTVWDRAGHYSDLRIEINFITEETDTDRDGIPDIWEYEHGMDALVFDSDDDPDGDGFTNLEEYIGEDGFSTDPRSSLSHPSRDVDSGFGGAWILILAVALILASILIYFLISRRK